MLLCSNIWLLNNKQEQLNNTGLFKNWMDILILLSHTLWIMRNFGNTDRYYWIFWIIQKKSPRGIPRKRCSENMQQIYRRTPMPQCNFNKIAKQLFWNRTLPWVLSCKFAAFFRTFFPGTHLGGFCPLQVFSLGLFPIFFPEAY